MPRFAVLAHDHPQPHWDLLLERGHRLRTWRLEKPLTAGAVIAAEALPDHRLIYLDYEGPVSGDRGTVTRHDQGDYETREETADRVVIVLRGAAFTGRIELTLTLPPHGWTAECLPDSVETTA